METDKVLSHSVSKTLKVSNSLLGTDDEDEYLFPYIY